LCDTTSFPLPQAYLNRIDAQGLYELVGCDPQELNWPHPDPYLRVVLSYEGLVHGRVYRAWYVALNDHEHAMLSCQPTGLISEFQVMPVLAADHRM
jgi:hypothetical protein